MEELNKMILELKNKGFSKVKIRERIGYSKSKWDGVFREGRIGSKQILALKIKETFPEYFETEKLEEVKKERDELKVENRELRKLTTSLMLVINKEEVFKDEKVAA